MKKRLFVLLALLFALAGFPSRNELLFALPDIAHEEITKMSSDIKYSLPESRDNGLKSRMDNVPKGYEEGFKKPLSDSNVSEDYPPNSTYGGQHYFDPTTGMGMWGIFPSAKSRALDLYNSAMQVQCFSIPLGLVNSNSTRPWELFAQAMHLVQDMTTPAHTIMQDHADGDNFEKYVEKNWQQWDQGTPEEGKIINPNTGQPYTGLKDYVENYANRNPYDSTYQLGNLSEYFEKLAKESQNFPKDGIKINTDALGMVTSIERVPISWEQKRRIAEDQLPKALMYGAGLINKFWDDISKSDMRTVCIRYSRIPAGGDYADDSFVVSNDFYLQTEFKLSEAALTDLYLKTAMKKGKIGVWYKKQFIETYVDLATIYKDSSNEIRDPILVKLFNIGKKSEQRVNQLQSDWEGAPDVALLTNGFFDSFIPLIRKIGDPVSLQDSHFNPQIVKDLPVLVIPSGGLFGLEKSEVFKASLDEYVKQGGTLIVFGQQHGYEFSVLPVPQEPDGTYRQVTGYGWSEDQSCFYGSSYIDTWQQFLSGQSRATPTINVDGYFTDYPSNATVILRRTANGQPDLLMYDYGQGRVIVNSMYSDYAFKQNQASPEEIALIRDMISWAKKPDQLPEIKPGQSVTVSVSVTNNTPNDASSLKLLTYNPDRTTLLAQQTINVSIPAGQSPTIPVTYTTTLGSALGIYHVDYVLYDSSGTTIQPQAETDSGRFVVSNPPANPYKPQDLSYSVNTPSEYFLNGQPIPFTVTVWNNSDADKRLRLYWDWFHSPPVLQLDEVTVAAHGSLTRSYTAAPYSGGWSWFYGTSLRLWVHFFEESGVAVSKPSWVHVDGESWPYAGSGSKGVNVVYPSASIALNPEKPVYAKGETVTINGSVKNLVPAGWQPNVQIAVYDSKYDKIFGETKTTTLPPSGTGSVSTSFVLPSTSTMGSYWVYAQVLVGGQYAGGTSTRFELPQSQISVSANLPTAFSIDTHTIPFTITNGGKINVSSGTIDLSLKDPWERTVYSGSQPFSIAVGESKTLDVSITIPSLKLGTYVLTYSQSDETRTGNPTAIVIPNSFDITGLTIDKPSYKGGETANLTFNVMNSGKFNLENLSLTVSAPGINLNGAKTISLAANSGPTPFSYAIPISENTSSGWYYVNVAIALPTGNAKSVNGAIYIPPSSLFVTYQGPGQASIGDTVQFLIENRGGVGTNYEANLYLFDKNWWMQDIKNFSGQLTVNGQTNIAYTFPDQLADGNYTLEIDLEDTNTNITNQNYFYFGITGGKASLSVKTFKYAYFSSETIETMSTIVNQGIPIKDGNLRLEIMCSGLTSRLELQSFYVYNQDWTEEIGELHFPVYYEKQELPLSISPDGSGSMHLQIEHGGAQVALLDYLALKDSSGNLYPPDRVVYSYDEIDITEKVRSEDWISAEVPYENIEATWANLSAGLSYSLVMTALEGNPCYVIWQSDTTISEGSGVTDTLNISALNIEQAGKYYLKGELTNRYGQNLGTTYYPFYVIDGDTVLQYNTDKRIYKTGEPVTVTGQIENRAAITAEGLELTLTSNYSGQSPVTLFGLTYNLLVGGSQPFTITTTAGAEGIVNLLGVVKKDNAVQTTIVDQYEVALPVVSMYVTIPQTTGNEAFPVEVELYNDGKVNATVQVGIQSTDFGDSQTITVPPGESKILQYTQQISKDSTYTFTAAGDLVDTQTYTVTYGLGAAVQFGDGSPGLGVKPEGNVDIVVTITSTGQMNESLTITYQVTTQNSQPVTITRTYNLQPGTNTTDILNLNLPEGEYQISANGQKPDASAQVSFSVTKENQADMAVSLGTQAGGVIPVIVNLANVGFNEINGRVSLSVTAGSGQVVWSGEQVVSQLTPQNFQLVTLNINPSAIDPGNYNLQVQLLSNSNQLIAARSLEFGVQRATFQITQLPPYQTFMVGQEATFVFRVKNIGGQEGSFDLRFKAYDLIDSTQREWLKPDEEKTISFGFMLPEDLEERDYFAEYELKALVVAGVPKRQVKYHLAGISLNVNASLDKPYYNEGETAHLTINIQSPNSNPQNLFARVNYAGYEPQQTFTLTGNQVLIFDVPLPKITGEKLFYGIYHEGGRSIHLNSLYIHKAGDVLTIETNKQVYNPSETVTMSVTGSVTGNMTLSAPGGYTETFIFTGLATKSFTLPATVAAGTYFISYQLSTTSGESYTGNHPFDVAGIQVKVLECNHDKGKYASSDTITTSFTISSNTAMPAILKAWIVDPTGQYASVGEQNITLSSSESSLITYNSPLNTSVSGIHRLVYGIYGPEDLLLCSGSEAFDVGDAVLMGISTDKKDYPTNTEPVTVTASLYGSVSADLQLELDGSVVKSETISLNGFTPYTTQLQSITPSPHTLKATLTAGGLKSTKETSFTYALAYMPKPQISASPGYVEFGNLNLGSTSTQTVSLSSTGNVDLVIGSIVLSGTNQGEFTVQNDNCSGKTIFPSGNCALDILFTPASLGAKSASLSIPSNAIDTPTLYLSLAGTGITALNISINPDSSGRVTGTGIDCPGDCVESFSTLGATIQLTATPAEGYGFVNWTGDISQVENPMAVNMDTNKNVTANFAVNTYTITPTAGLGGIISPSGSVTVNYGGSQTFTIMPNAGYHVADVRVDGASVGPVLAYTFSSVTSDHTIEVIFAINQYTLIATEGPNGTIVPSGPVIVDHGGNLTFTITPNTGYRISDVKVDGGSIGPVATHTFTNVTTAHTIEASFVINQHTITATAGPNGTIAPSGAVSVDPGGSQTFTIVPNTGYRISDVEVDGAMLGVTKSYTFGNVTSDHTISATFKGIQVISLPFSDDFEDDPVGTLPNLPWDNFNGGPAMVTGSEFHSQPNSLSVSSGTEGSGSAFVNLAETYPDRIAYEVWAKVDSTASSAYVGFSEEVLGIMPQFNAVCFNGTDGKVYFTSADRDHGFMVPLLDSFTIGVWHKVRVEIDFVNLIADVFIDDVHVGSGLQVSPRDATWEHEGTQSFQLNKIGVTHDLGEPFYFDDFSVSEWNPSTPLGLLRSAGPGQWGILGMGGIGSATSTSVSMSGSSSVKGVVANVGVADTGNVNMSGSSIINGILSLNTAGRLNKSGTSKVAGGVQQNTATNGVLDQAVADALAASQSAASLPTTITSPTSITISNPSQNITITGVVGTNVLHITNIAISNGTLTLSAPHGGSFIMNISGSFALSGASRIVLAGGITPSDVLYNFIGSGGGVAMSGGSSVAGIILAPQRGISLSSSTVTGEIISGGSGVAFSGTAKVNNPGP